MFLCDTLSSNMLIAPPETSMVQALSLLAQEEDEATAIGNHIPTHKVSPVTFLKQGLNLKEQQ